MPQKLGHNRFLERILSLYKKPFRFSLIQSVWKKAWIWLWMSPNLFKFCICLGFYFTICFFRKIHQEAFLKSTYPVLSNFRDIYNLISLHNDWFDVFEDWRRKCMIENMGILKNIDSSLSESFLARYVCVVLCIELKLTQTMRFLSKIIMTKAKNVVFESRNSSSEVW